MKEPNNLHGHQIYDYNKIEPYFNINTFIYREFEPLEKMNFINVISFIGV